MGKVLILINVAGLIVNLLVFLVVVNYFGGFEGEGGPINNSSSPSAPEITTADIEKIVEMKTANVSNSIKSLSQKIHTLTKDHKKITTIVERINIGLSNVMAQARSFEAPVAADTASRVVEEEAEGEDSGEEIPDVSSGSEDGESSEENSPDDSSSDGEAQGNAAVEKKTGGK